MSRWTWKQPRGHEQQTMVSWWVEQAAALMLRSVAIHAHKRGDKQTFDRVRALVKTAAEAERSAR